MIEQQKKQIVCLNSVQILKYLLSLDSSLDTMILCNPSQYYMTTTDEEVYFALSCLSAGELDFARLRKFFEGVEVASVRRPKKVLSPDDAENIRKKATGQS